jgi:hypothetical protein
LPFEKTFMAMSPPRRLVILVPKCLSVVMERIPPGRIES